MGAVYYQFLLGCVCSYSFSLKNTIESTMKSKSLLLQLTQDGNIKFEASDDLTDGEAVDMLLSACLDPMEQLADGHDCDDVRCHVPLLARALYQAAQKVWELHQHFDHDAA